MVYSVTRKSDNIQYALKQVSGFKFFLFILCRSKYRGSRKKSKKMRLMKFEFSPPSSKFFFGTEICFSITATKMLLATKKLFLTSRLAHFALWWSSLKVETCKLRSMNIKRMQQSLTSERSGMLLSRWHSALKHCMTEIFFTEISSRQTSSKARMEYLKWGTWTWAKLPKTECSTPRPALLTMPVLKFGRRNRTIKKATSGHWVASYMRCAHWIHLFAPKAWADFTIACYQECTRNCHKSTQKSSVILSSCSFK